MLQVSARQSKPLVRSMGYSGERLLNMFLRPSDTLSEAVILGRSGTTEYVDLIDPVRAIVRNMRALYAVAGSNVFKIETGGVVTNVGTVASTGDVYMAASGSEVAIVTGGRYYICDGTTTTNYATGAIDTPVSVTYQDGYFVVSGHSGGREDAFTVSGLGDGTTFDGLDFAFAENAPDAVRAIISDHGELWALGSETVEVFYNSGAADFPFTRNSGALMEHGCLHGKTVAKADNSVFWVRPDGAVVRASGGTPQVVTTREGQEYIGESTVLGGFTFTDRGHVLYAVKLEGKPDFVYDLTTQLWHERSTGTDDGEWFCANSVSISGVSYFGTDTGKIVNADADVFTDDGATIIAEAVSVPVDQAGEWFKASKIFMSIRSGSVSIGRTPQVFLQTTRDGRNWSVEKWRVLGTLGEYARRVSWHGLGAFRRGQFRVVITDPVPRDIHGIAYG